MAEEILEKYFIELEKNIKNKWFNLDYKRAFVRVCNVCISKKGRTKQTDWLNEWLIEQRWQRNHIKKLPISWTNYMSQIDKIKSAYDL